MVDRNRVSSFDYPYADPNPYRDGKSLSDYGWAFAARTAGIGSLIGAGLRAIGELREDDENRAAVAAEYLGRGLQEYFGGLEEDALYNLSPAAARDIQATFTDPNFWSLSTIALKLTQTAPELIVSVIPAVLAPGALASAAVLAGTGAAISAASVVDELYRVTDGLSDEELQFQVPYYRQLREQGVSEEEARREHNARLRGLKPLLTGVIGAITNAVGPAGQAARVLRGQSASALGTAGASLPRRVGRGLAEGAGAEVVQSGTEAGVIQQGMVDVGIQDEIDWRTVAKQAGEGAVLGGLLGGAVSIGGRGPSSAIPETLPDQDIGVDTLAEGAPTSPTAPNQPGGAVPAPGPEATPASGAVPPTTTQPDTPTPSTPPQVNVVEGTGPDAAQTAAINAQQAATPAPTPAPEAVTPPVAPETVQPDPQQPVPQQPTPAAPEAAPVTPEGNIRPPVAPETVQPVPQQPTPAAPEAAPVTPEGNIQPPVAPETVAPVEAPAPRPEVVSAQPEPEAVTQTPDVQAEVPPARTGPRILEDKTTPDYTEAWQRRVQENVARTETPVSEPVGRKRSKEEIRQRIATNEGALDIVSRFPPAEAEMGLMSRRPQEVQTARKLMLDRARAISREADRLKLTLPKTYRTTTDPDAQYNPETLLVMEAKRLAGLKNPSMADFQRFFDHELSIRSGEAQQIIDERRIAGDIEGRVSSDDVVDTLSDESTPETLLEEKEALDEEYGFTREDRKPVKTEGKVPKRVTKAVEDALQSAKRKPSAPTERKPSAPTERKPSAPKKVEHKPETKKADPSKTISIAASKKIAEIRARQEKARQETNPTPTPAQAEAGNYKKGAMSLHGMTVRIETPKGAERRGVGPDGRPWSVKMKHDYGYIEGTRGADGDPLDVYIGDKHDASYVYVVDQVDAVTKEFDEHKVLMAFSDEADAFIAYAESFSDGRGADRMGDMRKMTIAEFKEWIKNIPPRRAGATDGDIGEVQAFMAEEALNPTLPQEVNRAIPIEPADGWVVPPGAGRAVPYVSRQSAKDAMAQLSFKHLNFLQRAIAGTVRARLTNLVGDVPVYYVTPEVMRRISSDGSSPLGLFKAARIGDAVFIRSDLLDRPADLQHAVMHEVAHSATIRTIDNNPRLRHNILLVMDVVEQQLALGNILDLDGGLRYAMSRDEDGNFSPHEFVAEVLSNPRAQAILNSVDAPDYLVRALKLKRGKIRSAWDALVHVVRKGLDLSDSTFTMLEMALRVSEPTFAPRYHANLDIESFLIDGNIKPLQAALTERVKSMMERPQLQPSHGRPWLYRLRTFDSLARNVDRIFGGAENNPIRKIARLTENQRTRATQYYNEATPLLQKIHDAQKRYSKVRGENGQSVWENFTSFTLDETMSGVYADRPLDSQKHIRKGVRGAWQREQYKELSRRYNNLPNELKNLRAEQLEYFKGQQKKLALMTIHNRLAELYDLAAAEGGIEGLARRIFDKQVTDADKKIIGEDYDVLEAAGVLGRIDGPYYPLMRRGNWVLVAHQEITPPGNARQLAPNEFEFKTEAEAEAFVKSQTGRPEVRTVYVDPQTGETFGVQDGQRVRLTAEDINAEKRFRVTVQNKHVEMFQTEKEARAAAAELAAKGLKVDDVAPRNFDNYGIQAEALSPQIARMIQTLERRADERGLSPEQKSELIQAITEMSLQFMAGTRIQTRSLPRRNVAGASRDLTQNLHDYALAMGNHLAKAEFAPQINAAFMEAREYMNAHRNDGANGARQAVYNEAATRVTMRDPRTEGGFGAVVNRILTVSFIDKLATPSYSVINATQPMMITMPYLSGHYGVGRAWSEMSRAYRDIGTLQTIQQGFRDTVNKARNADDIPTDPASLIIGRLKNKRERDMLGMMVEWGALDTDAGLEISKLIRERRGIVGHLDGGIGYLEGISRQLPKAVEAINRSVTALAAYRLEFARSKDHDKAVRFAYDTVNLTQFNYSHTNANLYMNHPMLRMATQFKKFGVGMYQFLGEQAGIAIDSTRTPQERAAAIKALSYTIGMHVAIAGAMGLPTEPIRMVVTMANALGITDWTWADVEIGQREALAGLFGRDLGEALARGIPRLAGVDLSTRMGIDTLMGPFGEPRSNEAQDLKAYMWDALSGAPAGLIIDVTKGVGDLVEGDIMRAMERLVPLKAFSDTLKAYRQMTEGTISERTGKQVASPYSFGEAAIRSFGFIPAREAEGFERSNMFYHKRDMQEMTRREYMREWSEASGAARGRIWREIVKWNKSQPRDVRISLSDLRLFKSRIERDMRETREGLLARRRERHILDRADRTFNFEP